MKQLKAARKAHEIGRGKVVSKRCEWCNRFAIVSVAEHEKHETRCHRRSRAKAK